MLSSGAHVKIDADEFLLDESIEGHYIHRRRDLQVEHVDITGEPGKQQLFGDSLMWSYTDWAGGEGQRIYIPSNADVYNIGYEVNPRVRGQLTGRPARGRATVTAANEGKRTLMTVADGAVWIIGGVNAAYSRGDPTVWTNKSTAEVGLNPLSANYYATSVAGDHEWLYIAGWHAGASGTRVLMQVSRSDAGSPNTVVSEATNKAAYAGLATMDGKLYGWTGRRLYEHDVDQTFPLASEKVRKVFDTGVDPSTSYVFRYEWWAECVGTENSILFYYSTEGQSEVYEYKKGVGRLIWRAPMGFTIKGCAYQNGIAYFSGNWGGELNRMGWAELWALPLDSYRPIPLKQVRRFDPLDNSGTGLQDMAPSYGYEVMLSNAYWGNLFIYDAETDGLTMLDDLGNTAGTADPDGLIYKHGEHKIQGLATLGRYRYAGVYQHLGTPSPALKYQVVYWSDDEPNQRETGLSLSTFVASNPYFQSSKWDYGYPMDRKSLIGFHLTFEPLTAGMLIDVSYSLDGATYVDLTQITSATSGASEGRVFIPVSLSTTSQKKFFQLEYRVRLTSTVGNKTPIIYGVTAEAKTIRKREEWELVIRLKDESSQTRPLDRQVLGPTIRDWLETTVKSGSVVVFRDGYRYKDTGQYTSHNVMIKEMQDVTEQAGQGSCRLLLVATSEAT